MSFSEKWAQEVLKKNPKLRISSTSRDVGIPLLAQNDTKYKNTKTNGYDSKKESHRAADLALMEKAGVISNLQEQVIFLIQDKFIDNMGRRENAITYVADFVYNQNGRTWCEDVKSPVTKKLPAYVMKRKLFKKLNPNIFFIET